MKKLLEKAAQSMALAVADIRSAHTLSIGDDNQFAEIVLLELLGDARKLSQRLAQALDAANASGGKH